MEKINQNEGYHIKEQHKQWFQQQKQQNLMSN
jgi:hypothetical protein